MIKVTQLERGFKGPNNDPGITGKAFEKYGIIVLLENEKGQLVEAPECLKDIEEPTWIVVGDENTTWEDLERFLLGFTPEELKVMKAKVED